MSGSRADRNLLLGILALQNALISRDDLLAAVAAWLEDKSTSLGRVLLERGMVDRDEYELLAALVDKHIENHDDSPEKSLAAISSVEPFVRDALCSFRDDDVEASVARLPPASVHVDPNATASLPTAEVPNDGQRFRVLRPHAKGGLGQVSVALDVELNREVALKEIQPEHADRADSRGRFVQEAEITGGLEHPGIVPVYGLGQYADGRPFYAMRFIRGDSLKIAAERFHAQRPAAYESVEFRKLLGRFIDVCQAINYAHSRGILHRDLKPGNVMLGKYGETLVVDWGLAKSLGRREVDTQAEEAALQPASGSGTAPTQMGTAMGTPPYMSPEQADGRLDLLGPASDVYGLGATLYFLLTGRAPVVDDDLGIVLQRVQAGDFPPPRSIQPGIPRPLEAICLKAMAKRQADRYGSPAELSEEIENWLAGESVQAWPEPAIVRMRRWTRRHRALVTAASAGIVVALLSLIVGVMVVASKNRLLESNLAALDQATQKLETRNQQLDEQADRAQRSELAARRRAYGAHLRLAANARLHGNWRLVRSFLEREISPSPDEDLRDFEWRMLWNFVNNRQLVARTAAHNEAITAIACSRDGTHIATAGGDGSVHLWSADNLERLQTLALPKVAFGGIGVVLTTDHQGQVIVGSKSPGGPAARERELRLNDRLLAFTDSDDTPTEVAGMSIVEIAQRMRGAPGSKITLIVLPVGMQQPRRITLTRQAFEIADAGAKLLFSPDGERLLIVDAGRILRTWDFADRDQLETPFGSTPQFDIAVADDGRTIHSVGPGGALHTLDLANGHSIVAKPLLEGAKLRSAAISPERSLIATFDGGEAIHVWNASSQTRQQTFQLEHAYDYHLSFDGVGRRLIAASTYGIETFDLHAPFHTALSSDSPVFSAWAFPPSDHPGIVATSDGSLKLWSREVDNLPPVGLARHSVGAVCFSPAGEHFYTGDAEGTLACWRAVHQSEQHVAARFPHAGNIYALAFSPDQRQLAVGGVAPGLPSATLRLVGLPDLQPAKTLQQGYAPVRYLAALSDGKHLASATLEAIELWNATKAELQWRMYGRAGSIAGLALSEDGKLLATSEFRSQDGQFVHVPADLVSTSDGVRVARLSDEPLQMLTFAGSDTLVGVHGPSDVFPWTTSQWQLWAPLQGVYHAGRHFDFDSAGPQITTATIISNADVYAVGRENGVVEFWDVTEFSIDHEQNSDVKLPTQPRFSLQAHQGPVGWLFCSGDGQTLVTAAADPTNPGLAREVKLWSKPQQATSDVWSKAPTEPIGKLPLDGIRLLGAAIAPDGTRVAGLTANRSVRIWERDGNGFRDQWVDAEIASATHFAFSQDGTSLFTGDISGGIYAFDAETGRFQRMIKGLPPANDAHADYVSAAAFLQDGRTLATASGDATIKLWDVVSGDVVMTIPAAHEDRHAGWITDLVLSADDKTIVSSSADGTVKVWDLKTGTLKSLLAGHDGVIQAIALSPDGVTLATAGRDSTIKLWNLAAGEVEHTLTGHEEWVTDVSFSPDGRILASSAGDNTVKLWDIIEHKAQHTLEGHQGWVSAVDFSPGGQTLASAGEDATVRLWQVGTGMELMTLRNGLDFAPNAIAFSDDGTLLAAAGNNALGGQVRLWHAPHVEPRDTKQ